MDTVTESGPYCICGHPMGHHYINITLGRSLERGACASCSCSIYVESDAQGTHRAAEFCTCGHVRGEHEAEEGECLNYDPGGLTYCTCMGFTRPGEDGEEPEVEVAEGPGEGACSGACCGDCAKCPNCAFAKVPERSERRLAGICEDAVRIVGGDKTHEYEHPWFDFGRCAALWGAYLGIAISRIDVGMMLDLMKTSREAGKRKRDNIVDKAGYDECMGMLYEYADTHGLDARAPVAWDYEREPVLEER